MEKNEKKYMFALDIGTRSVIGLVGEAAANGVTNLIAFDRREHHTRAMLDGQIHDVTEVAQVLAEVKKDLEERCGPLKKVSVAAAGRALCTIKASADMDVNGHGTLTANDEHALELAAIQHAQRQLATSNAVPDPTSYYCVGYSIISFTLDDTPIKSLIGQRGRTALIEIIATFLPRQVIDSLQSAIQTVDLEMSTLTLEPIAAINVLIPPTMRHLNLVLVDVGAGTSDVAITRDGSVIGYGMVPFAGDEITEAISQKYLMDFNVAESVKRQLGVKNKKIPFTDVLGMAHKVAAGEILEAIKPKVGELAQAIAEQILALNQDAPQAVLLVGGGSLTPMLPEALAQALDVPPERVAIRRPDGVQEITNIPPELCTPDAVTPLGILKLSGSRTLNFVNVVLNEQQLSLFNLGTLTIADALLSAGLDVRSLHGRPGMGFAVSVNGQTQFVKGTSGKAGSILLNGEEASFEDPIKENDVITVVKGIDGEAPQPVLQDIVDIPPAFPVTVNETRFQVPPLITVNGLSASVDTLLSDRDEIICRQPDRLEEVLNVIQFDASPADFTYTINDTERSYRVMPLCRLSRAGKEIPAGFSTKIQADDRFTIEPPKPPAFSQLLGIHSGKKGDSIHVIYHGKKCPVPTRKHTISIDGKSVKPEDIAQPGSVIQFSTLEQPAPGLNDVLLALEFDTRSLSPGVRVDILVNGKPAEYTAPVKNGDNIDIVVKK